MELRKGVVLAMIALTTVLPDGAQAARSASGPAPEFVPEQVLVAFEHGAEQASKRDALRRVGGTTIERIPVIDHEVVTVGEGITVLDAVRILRAHDAVRTAEPNYIGRLQGVANDRCLTSCSVGAVAAKQWAPAAVNAPAGWQVYPGRFYTAQEKKALTPLRVAVLDTKIDITRSDWINTDPGASAPWDARNGGQIAVEAGADFVDPSQQAGNATYHGTFIAGLLAAATNNTIDLAGIGYRAEIVPITVVDGNGTATASALAQGIIHAVGAGAKVINMSLGISGGSSTVQAAIDHAHAMGALSIAAAGNNANASPFYPAWHANVMAVTATDEADRPGYCTNFSSRTSVAAPGAGVVGLDPRTASGLSIVPCGTSTAAPHVSGLAALLFAQDPARTPDQVRAIIEATADDDRFRPGRDDYFGKGRINVERALRYGDGTPVVTAVRATPPAAQNGSSTITAYATVVSAGAITDAEFFLDEPVAPGSGSQIEPADGSWGGTTETLATTLVVDTTVATGVHRLYVRAKDQNGWGASAAGVLIVDRTPPRILDFKATNPGAAVLPVSVSFGIQDDYAQQASYVVRVTNQLSGAVAYESVSVPTAVPSLNSHRWVPKTTDVGPHRIDLVVVDESNNTTQASTSVVVL